MESTYTIAGRGLKRMFTGEIVSMIGLVVLLIPVFGITGLVAILVGGIMAIVGLWGAREAHEGYKRAFVMLVAGGVLSILGTIAGDGGAGTLFDVLDSIAGMLQTYFVCTATAALLRELGHGDEAHYGDLVWKANAGCYAVLIAVSVLALFAQTLALVLTIITGLVGIVIGIIYVVYLYKSQDLLLG